MPIPPYRGSHGKLRRRPRSFASRLQFLPCYLINSQGKAEGRRELERFVKGRAATEDSIKTIQTNSNNIGRN